MKKLGILLVFMVGCLGENVEPETVVIPNCYVREGFYDFQRSVLFDTCGLYNDRDTFRAKIRGGFNCVDTTTFNNERNCVLYYKWREKTYYGVNDCIFSNCSYSWEMTGRWLIDIP